MPNTRTYTTAAPNAIVLALVVEEMNRTDENHESYPSIEDYLVDVIRFLNRQLPEHEQLFTEA